MDFQKKGGTALNFLKEGKVPKIRLRKKGDKDPKN